MELPYKKYGLRVLLVLSALLMLFCERNSSPLPEIIPKITPSQGSTTTTFLFDLSETFGQDLNNKIFVRWDWEGDGVFDTPFLHEKILSHRYFASGSYHPKAQIKDLSGQIQDSSFQVEVIKGFSQPRAVYEVYPETGNITTLFVFDASLTKDDEDSLSSLLFKWDFEGDGKWDTELNHEYRVEHIFPVVQGYFPKVYVEDPSRRANSFSKVLRVTLLDTCIVAGFSTNPDSLVQNEETCFDASSSFYSCNANERLWYKWDFDNDLIFDTEWLENPEATHTFPMEKEYRVRLVVKNSQGLENSLTKTFWVHHQNRAPIARINTSSYGGNTQTEFRFDAWPSSDTEEAPSQMWNRWDLDGDGHWDLDWSHDMEVFHSYSTPGVYNLTMEIMDRGGLSDTVQETIYINTTNFETGRILDKRGSKWEYYGTVKIGNQWWMTKNLSVDYPKFYDNKIINEDLSQIPHFGFLYTPPFIYAACPEGWKIPSKQDWNELFTNFKEEEVFEELVLGGNSGLNLVFGGMITRGSSNFQKFGYYWSSTAISDQTSDSQWFISLDRAQRKKLQGYGPGTNYYSVRCIKD